VCGNLKSVTPERLGWTEAVAALDALAGRRISVRIVLARDPETLVAVFHGRLGTAGHDKAPSLFWPLDGAQPGDIEQPGVYLSETDFDYAERRAGGILIVSRGDVLVNVRPLPG
jgi:hypothetical protein